MAVNRYPEIRLSGEVELVHGGQRCRNGMESYTRTPKLAWKVERPPNWCSTSSRGMTDEPIVIKNLKYDGAARNEGFILMPDEIEPYRVGARAFEFKGTSGFMITIDITSRDVR